MILDKSMYDRYLSSLKFVTCQKISNDKLRNQALTSFENDLMNASGEEREFPNTCKKFDEEAVEKLIHFLYFQHSEALIFASTAGQGEPNRTNNGSKHTSKVTSKILRTEVKRLVLQNKDCAKEILKIGYIVSHRASHLNLQAVFRDIANKGQEILPKNDESIDDESLDKVIEDLEHLCASAVSEAASILAKRGHKLRS